MIRPSALLALLPLLLNSLPAGAQATTTHQHPLPPTAAAGNASPASAARSAAPAQSRETTQPFTSAYRNYRRFDPNEPLTDWRRANDTVREIGGWQAYAKESARANAPAANATGDKK